MIEAIKKYLYHMRYVRNASPETLRKYAGDLQQFVDFLTPPGEPTLRIAEIDHRIIREFVAASARPATRALDHRAQTRGAPLVLPLLRGAKADHAQYGAARLVAQATEAHSRYSVGRGDGSIAR